jgi:hypothetical protein
MDALEDIPKIESPLLTEKGEATLQKTDIFRKIMWFGFKEESNWYPLDTDRVNHILRMNREGKKPATLTIDVVEEKIAGSPLNSDLDQMDRKFKSKAKPKRKKKRGPGQGPVAPEGAAPTTDAPAPTGGQPQGGGRQNTRNSGNAGNNPQNRQSRGGRDNRGENRGGGTRDNRGGRGGRDNRGPGRDNRAGGENQNPKPENPQ